MPSIQLSENALALLKMRARFYQVEDEGHPPDAYHELIEAGFLAFDPALAVGPGFRLTDDGWRMANAEAAAEHLPHLSDQALSLLQSHLAAIGLRNGGATGYPTDRTARSLPRTRQGRDDGCLSQLRAGPGIGLPNYRGGLPPTRGASGHSAASLHALGLGAEDPSGMVADG